MMERVNECRRRETVFCILLLPLLRFSSVLLEEKKLGISEKSFHTLQSVWMKENSCDLCLPTGRSINIQLNGFLLCKHLLHFVL